MSPFRLHGDHIESLLVLGPGSVYGASGEARRLEQAKEITLTAATACTLLWVHPDMIAARLGNACIAKIVDQEVASLNVARSREPVKKIQKLSTIEREERAERDDAHFRTRSMPLSPESAKHRKAFLVTSVSMVRKTGNHRGLRNIFIEPDQMRPEDVEVKRPPLPRSGDPDAHPPIDIARRCRHPGNHRAKRDQRADPRGRDTGLSVHMQQRIHLRP